ncbi:hypothetical protein [Pseudoalteromonas peptidolytica]|uniref:hypothetical protein n=1 Tax=Pseudoalteromonas peptidolytica TaxID=61150 RepID=UPI00298DEF55|nr:hypothetical protein [Pseudoalteromonas peptidolytica]MDW7551546.1 hypothetical protein [Pseudoalteromonas peptidolytica]
MKVLKYILISAVTLFVLFVILMLFMFFMNKNSNYNPKFSESKLIHEVAGESFYIPRNYIWSYTKISENRVFLPNLHAIIPEFDGFTEANKDRYEKLGWHDEITFLIEDASKFFDHMKTNELRAQDSFKNYVIPESKREWSGFEVYDRTTFRDEFYYIVHNGESYYFTCNKTDSVPYPSCKTTHNINDKIYVSYTFAKKHLANWQSIHNDLMGLIDKFRKNHD